jgi:uncharacterized protein
MPHITSYRHGVPNWIDVSSPDPAAAAAFYGALFGWDAPEAPPEFGGYRIFSKNGLPVAGVGPLTEGPPSWTTYINVDDADAAAARVSEAGGTLVVPPMDLPAGNGRIGFAIDPAGGFVGLFQAGPNHSGAALVNELGTLVWNELNVRDPHSVTSFYSQVFGWDFAAMEGAPSEYHVVMLHGRAIAGVMTMNENFPEHVPTHWLPYFVVENAAATAAACEANGGGVVVPPYETGMGPMAVLHDPAGAVFAIGAMAETEDPNEWPA